MPTEKSVKQVEELKKVFETSPLVIAAQYRGLKMVQLTSMRAALKPMKARFRVVKNTLAGIAANQAKRPAIREVMGGPVGIITGEGDPVAIARTLSMHIQSNRLEIKLMGGVLGDQVLTPARLDDLSKLPAKEVLLARLLGQMNAPVTSLVFVLNANLRGLAVALQRIAEQKAKQADAPAHDAAPESTPASA